MHVCLCICVCACVSSLVLCAAPLRLDADARQLELALARSGCEVHRFDPSGPRGHQHDSAMWHHSLSVGWRDPNPAVPPQQQRGTAKKLATILSDFGHRTVRRDFPLCLKYSQGRAARSVYDVFPPITAVFFLKRKGDFAEGFRSGTCW